jgi:hypothetical protein
MFAWCLFGLLLIYCQFVPVAPQSIGIKELILIILGGFSFIVLLIKYLVKEKSFQFMSFDIPLIILIWWMLTSLFVAKVNDVNLYSLFRQIAPFTGLLFYFVLKNNINSLKDIKLITFFFILAALICVIEIPLVFAKFSPKSLLLIRADMGDVAYESLIYAFEGFLVGYIAASRRNNLIYLILLFATLLIHLLTLSRSVLVNYLFLICAYGFIVFNNSLKRKKYSNIIKMSIVISVVITLAYALIGNSNYSGIINIYSNRFQAEPAYEGRIDEMRGLANAVIDSYLLGEGMGSRITFAKKGKIVDKPYTHNLFTYIMFTLGVPGLILIIWFIKNIISTSIKTRKLIRNADILPYFYGYLTSLLSVLIYVQFESVYRHVIFSLIVALNLAVLARISLMVRKSEKIRVMKITGQAAMRA